MTSPLLTPTEADRAIRAGAALLDIQWNLVGPPGAELYAAAHLPGAVHLDLETALAGAPGVRGRHPLPDPAVLQQALRAAGLRAGQAVVVYDQQTSLAAARAWWVLRWAGVTEVSVLDGGLAAWRRAGLPVTTEVPDPPLGDVEVDPDQAPFLNTEAAAAAAASGWLVDVRTAERYRGESEPIDAVAGHIPGAHNLPMGLALHDDGTFRSPDEIRALLAEIGLADETRLGTTCGSGVTAAQMALALEHAGIAGVPYIGSWSEWISDSQRPIATI